MAVFKCKMCGGELDVQEGQTIATCDYCGTKQTVPSDCSEELRTLYNRANVLRMKSEFDKAEQIYERIITVDPKQAEAYWGALLCKYGIEYVEDPKTYKRIPTCHRVSYDAMEADEYYKLALDNADSVQRKIYEEEAKYIDEVQKEILAISSKEEAFDVFICYKETDENGKRTKDSVIANDIYYQLTQEGYRVFYAAITLEDKLGSAYEPVIFAALNSAKVMLVIGTKPEYFNAVWVKNEWSRYIKLIKSDHKKLLIPCYQDMDAYELPEEFAHLQAQDMGKVGFISNIVRGIKKVVGKEDGTKEKPSVSTSVAEPLLKRAYMFAEEKDWKNANQYAEKVLDIEPENAEAYIVKLLCDLKVPTLEDLSKQLKSFTDNANFKKAEKFADDRVSAILKQCVEASNDFIYNTAKEKISNNKVEDIFAGQELLNTIQDWRDSKQLAEQCNQLVSDIRNDAKSQLAVLRKKYGFISSMVSVGDQRIVGFTADGKSLVEYWDNAEMRKSKVESWTDVVQVAAAGDHIIALKKNGTVVAEGNNKYQECNVGGWKNIIKIVTNPCYTVGLRSDGMLEIAGFIYGDSSGEHRKQIKEWRNIKDIYIGDGATSPTTIGLTTDGHVVVAGKFSVLASAISEWTDVVEVAITDNAVMGLRSDGGVNVLYLNKQSQERYSRCYNFKSWENIVSIKVVNKEFYGLTSGGTILGLFLEIEQSDNNFVAISGFDELVGVRKDGTIRILSDLSKLDVLVRHWKLFKNADNLLKEISDRRVAEKNKEANAKAAKEKKINKLNKEKDSLTEELSSLGLFALKRKGEIKARLEQIEDELKKLV